MGNSASSRSSEQENEKEGENNQRIVFFKTKNSEFDYESEINRLLDYKAKLHYSATNLFERIKARHNHNLEYVEDSLAKLGQETRKLHQVNLLEDKEACVVNSIKGGSHNILEYIELIQDFVGHSSRSI